MKTLVLNGSPKRDKSDILRITSAFLDGMQDAIAQFRLCFPGRHPILTVPESPMFSAPEAAVVTEPRLALVRKAGHQFARTREIAPELVAEIGTPMIPEEQYASIVNGGA